LKDKSGVTPRVLTWPYGKWTAIGSSEARQHGIQVTLEVSDTFANVRSLYPLPRIMIVDNPPINEFIAELKRSFVEPERKRVVQIDLDSIYDDDAQAMERNLDALIERLYKMNISTVYLQAFCDDDGSGNIASVYFPNRILPMKADIFNRVANQLAIREIEVYAWMPMLSIVLPDHTLYQALRVKEWQESGEIITSPSWYARLSPFSETATSLLCTMYEDLAAHARIDGVVFLDDGYLNAEEDFHPAAMQVYRTITGSESVPPWDLPADVKTRWIQAKINALDTLCQRLAESVRIYRPKARFSRTLYAAALDDPGSGRTDFAQDYPGSLTRYDYVNIMAYPMMEEAHRPVTWLRGLVNKAHAHQGGLEKTIFKLQAYDWNSQDWIDSRTLIGWMRALAAEGAHHIGYYPDDFARDIPAQKTVRMMMSTKDFPFEVRIQENGSY
jgi:poly-beta-1,6-N-acetyl-D-glucosamine N-deacetylase